MARVVHCKHAPEESYFYVGRPSIFGNPFPLYGEDTRAEAIRNFEAYFNRRIDNDDEFKAEVLGLHGSDLACWCAPRACHADVILTWLEKYALTIEA